MPAVVYELSDGEQLEVLECEGDYSGGASSVSTGGGDRGDRRVDCAVFGVHANHYRDGVSGVGCGGAAGVFVEQRAAALDGCELALRCIDIDRTTWEWSEEANKMKKVPAPRANSRYFDCATRDETARVSAQGENFYIAQSFKLKLCRYTLVSCSKVPGIDILRLSSGTNS